MKPFPVHFAVDLEPDERLPSRADHSFDNADVALDRMATWRGRLAQATGAPVQFGWYVRMDKHIEALYGDPNAIALRYKSALGAAADYGDEIGLHIHCIDQTPDGRWRANYADPAVVAANIDESTANFRTVFGRSAKAARMGDMWMNDESRRRLAQHEIRYDLTLETGLRPQGIARLYPGTASKGWRRSMLGAPLAPFSSALPDRGEIWTLPLASTPRVDFHRPGMWLVSAYSSLTTGFRRNRARLMLRPHHPWSRESLRAALDRALNEGSQPGFCFAIRNYGAAAQVDLFLQTLCEIAEEKPLRFCAPEEYVQLTQLAA